MSKTLIDVGVGAALIGAAVLTAGSSLAVSAPMLSMIVSTLAASGAGFVLQGIGTLLGQKGGGISTTSRNPLAPWQVVYGRKKVGGTVIYQEEVASSNRILLLVIAVACHPCEQIEQVWLNNKKVQLQINPQFGDPDNPNGFLQSFDPPQGNWQIETISRTNDVVSVTFTQNPNSHYSNFNGETIHVQFSRDSAGGNSFDGYFPVVQTGDASFTYTCGGPQGNGTGHPGTITSTWPQYKGTVTVGYYPGDQTQVSGIISGNTVGYWSDASIVSGRTYVAMKLVYDSTIYNGMPEISFVLQGKNDIYDPRTGTRGYTNNAALCIADYLAQPLWGFNARYGDQIPDAPLIAAANLCDEPVLLATGGYEPRYSCDGAFDVSVKRGDVLANLLTSCAGRLVFIGGQFFIQPAGWVTPNGAITVGSGDTGPLMMMNSSGLVAEYYNNPAGVYIPDCAGSTAAQFIYALGMIQAYLATGNQSALALARLIVSPIESTIFRAIPVPALVTSTNIWSPNHAFDVKQPFLGDGAAVIGVDQDFASDLSTPAGWRSLATAEIQTSCDAYNWLIRLFALLANVEDGVSTAPPIPNGYGITPYGTNYGSPTAAITPVTIDGVSVTNPIINSGWAAMEQAILQMAAIAYNVPWQASYPGGAVPFIAEFTGQAAPALTSWQGPYYSGFQSPWAVKQANASAVPAAVAFLAAAQVAWLGSAAANDTVVFTVTGANPQTLSVPIQVTTAGYANTTFSLTGLNTGVDTIVATLPSKGLSSNAAEIAWSPYAIPVGLYNCSIQVMGADGTGCFNTATVVLATQATQGLMFNSHPFGLFPGDPHQSGNTANPFVSNAVGTASQYQGDLAILNTQGRFNAVMTGVMSVETAGHMSFSAYVNSSFVIGVQGATYVSGLQAFGSLAGGTAQLHFPALAGLNTAAAWPGGNWAQVDFVLNFPAGGNYNFEIDYASGLFSERQFCLVANGAVIPNIGPAAAGSATATGTAPSGPLQLTPWSGGAALGQTVAYDLALSTLSYPLPVEGPFAPVYFPFGVPAGQTTWGPAGTWGWSGPDPDATAGKYQYRPLAELADLIASCDGTESYYGQAVSVLNSFITWLVGAWTVAASGPPNSFPQGGPVTTSPDVESAALILHTVLVLDLAARPGGAGAMNTQWQALLNNVYAMFQALYLSTGPMAGTFCIDPTGAQNWRATWAGEILRSLSMLVQWATVNTQPAMRSQAIVWIDGLITFGQDTVVVVDPDQGFVAGDLAGAVTWSPRLARTDLFNGVKGSFISEANQWQQSDFPSYAQDTIHGYTGGDPAFDNDLNWQQDGQRLWKDVQLPFTTSGPMAQRLAKIELMRCRQQGRGMLAGMMSMYGVAPLDIVYFSFAPFGWTNKVLEVANVRLIQSKADAGGREVTLLHTELDIQEADSSVYQWNVWEELSAQGYSYLPGLVNQTPD